MQPSSILLRFTERPRAELRLLCFAHAGGGASVFAPWSRVFPESIEVVGVQLPGREGRRREMLATDMSVVVAELVAHSRFLLDRPFALFGHSLGALIAFECARALRAGGGPAPIRLLVSAARAPQRPRSQPTSHLPDGPFIQAITRRYSGIPQPVLDDPELLQYFLPILRADLRLFELYQYTESGPLSYSIDAFGGVDDSYVPMAELDAWSEQTTGSFRSQMYPGGHFYLTSARDRLLRSIQEILRPRAI